MTISITPPNLSVAVDAPQGTLIGTFNTDNLRLQTNPNGWFVIVGRVLATTWTGQAIVGTQSIQVHAPGGPPAAFTITITATVVVPPPPPPPPPPPSPQTTINVNGTTNAVVTTNTLTVNVANAPGNPTDWVGLAPAGSSDGTFGAWYYLNGTHTAPTSGMVSAAVVMPTPPATGAYEARLYPNNGHTVAVRAGFTVGGVAPPRSLVLFLSLPAQLFDNSPAGTAVSKATVTYSDGTAPVSVTLTSSDPLFVFQGTALVLSRALTPADDGTRHVTVTASDGLGATMSLRLYVR